MTNGLLAFLFFSNYNAWAGSTAGSFLWLQKDKQAEEEELNMYFCCECSTNHVLLLHLTRPSNYSRREAKHDVIVCYCIHLGGRRHGSQLLNQLEQGIGVSIGARKPGLLELAIMLCSYVPFLSPSGD